MNHIATNSLTNPMNSIDHTQSIMPILWKFLYKSRRPCFISMNVYKSGNEFVVSIINSKKIKRFYSTDNQSLLKNLSSYLKV